MPRLERLGTTIANWLDPQHPPVWPEQGLYLAAEPLSRRAIAILESSAAPDYPTLIEALKNFASILSRTGRRVEANPSPLVQWYTQPNTKSLPANDDRNVNLNVPVRTKPRAPTSRPWTLSSIGSLDAKALERIAPEWQRLSIAHCFSERENARVHRLALLTVSTQGHLTQVGACRGACTKLKTKNKKPGMGRKSDES